MFTQLNSPITLFAVCLHIFITIIFSIKVGSEFENEIFEGLQTAMRDSKNTVVLSGLTLKDYNLVKLGEFDFIVISSTLKSIIQIEAKKGNNKKNKEDAETQLNRGQSFFEENFPFPKSENWKYVKMMCFGESVEKGICENCKPFILGSNLIKENTIQSVREEIANQFLSFLNTFFDGHLQGKIAGFGDTFLADFHLFINNIYSLENRFIT
jgi:hypothetical protein